MPTLADIRALGTGTEMKLTKARDGWNCTTIVGLMRFDTYRRGSLAGGLSIICYATRLESNDGDCTTWDVLGSPAEAINVVNHKRATKNLVSNVHQGGLHAWAKRCQALKKDEEARRWDEVQKRHAVA